MIKEFNLSEQRADMHKHIKGMGLMPIQIERIMGMMMKGDKEFIKRLKGFIGGNYKWSDEELAIYKEIDKLAGEKLT